MEARDRLLPEWFNRTRSGQLRLPRFQRGQEWTHNEIQPLVNAVLRDLPVGAALILEVGDAEPFVSRPMAGAPQPTSRATEHLLDGQQRLTALWRAFHDDYELTRYFVEFVPDEDEQGDDEVPQVRSLTRWTKRGQLYPLWVDNPTEVYERGLVPLTLFRPEDVGGEVGEWCDAASGHDIEASRQLERRVLKLRERINAFNLPFLSLPPGTPRHTALEVFIKMNTSYVRLTAFDIVVAQVEERTGESLTDLREQLLAEIPEADDYLDLDDFILSVAALRQDRPPTQNSYVNLDFQGLIDEWGWLREGIESAVGFLTEERVYDADRLPTSAVPSVLAALHNYMPRALDGLGNARSLLRKYIWRAFLTPRYASSAASNAFQDFRALRDVLTGKGSEEAVPIFMEADYPYPTSPEELVGLAWPKRRRILARGLLAVALKGGARDIADDTPVSRQHILKRQYHHLFPFHLLTEDGEVPPAEANQALNCALITWNTNLDISAKEPLQYLKERTERAAQHLGEDAIRERLASHVIPFDELAAGGYDVISDPAERSERIDADYRAFLLSRAEALLAPIKALCQGLSWPSGVQ